MTRFRRVERRLFEAVLFVLAGGCATPTSPTAHAPSQSAPVAPAEVKGPDGPTRTAPSGWTATTPPDAMAACTSYMKTVSGKGVVQAYFDATRVIVNCTVVRDVTTGTAKVMHTPDCCRRAGPPDRQAPCPPASLIEVRTETRRLETVELRENGTIGARTEGSQTTDNRPGRHACGRRPEGMRLAGDEPSNGAGAQLAAMAELEAASVPAFERLARELAHHGAPAPLVRRARAAMSDEVRHARVMTELAARFGATPRVVDVPSLPCRSLAAIALENAIEGCVREAYGALVATHQAACAAPELRDAFERIADDERRHAALAEDVHVWILAQLAPDQRTEIELARARAASELRAQLVEAPHDDVLGLPAPDRAIALFDAYFVAA